MDAKTMQGFVTELDALYASHRDELPAVMDDYYRRLAEFITADISGANRFVCESPECTPEMFVAMSSVFDDVAELTRSRDFIEAMGLGCQRFAAAAEKYHIHEAVEDAETLLV